MDDLLAVGDLLRAAAVIGVVQRRRAAVKRLGQRDDLEGRARLIAVGNAAVSPLLQARRSHSLIVFRFCLFKLLRPLLQAEKLLILLLKALVQNVVIDLQMVVRIVASQRRHCDDRASVYVHDDAECAVLDLVAVDGRLKILFQIRLHRRIHRQHKAVAVAGVVVFLIGKGHFRAVVSLGRHDLARRTLQIGVVVGLESLRTDVVVADEAQQLRTQRGIGVIALGVRFQIDALDVAVVDERAHLVRKLFGDLLLNDLVAVGLIGRLLTDEILRHVQNAAQAHCDPVEQVAVLRRFHLLRDLVRVDEHCLHRRGAGKNVHVPIVDLTAGGRQLCIPGLVIDCKLLIIIVIHDHELIQPSGQRQKQRDAEEAQQDPDPRQDRAACPAFLLVLRGRLPPFSIVTVLRTKYFECHLHCLSRCCVKQGRLSSSNRPCQNLLSRLHRLTMKKHVCGSRVSHRLLHSMPPMAADMRSDLRCFLPPHQ